MPTELQYKISKKFLEREYIEKKLSSGAIASIAGCSQWVILDRLRLFRIEIRDKRWKLPLYRTKYSIDKKFFDKIIPDVAWVLGWLLSDGSIRLKPNKYFIIKLKTDDQDVLLKIKKILQYTGPLYKSLPNSKLTSKGVIINSSGYFLLKVSNEYLLDRLVELGFRENKTLRERFLKEVEKKNDENVFRSFIRGIFEGDGSVMFDKKRFSLCFQIVGTYELLETVQEYLIRYCDLKKTRLTNNIRHKNHFALRYRGNIQALRILEWLYKGSKNINRMNRKYNKFLLIKKKIKTLNL